MNFLLNCLKTFSWAWVLALVLVPVESLAVPDIKVSLTNTLTTEARTNNFNGLEGDDNYQALIDRFNLKLVSGDLTATSRIDMMSFRDAPTDGFVDDATWEQVTVQYRKAETKLLAGDFYRQLGRGILLAIRKVDEAGLDIKVRGAQAQYVGDVHRSSLFGGVVNSVNLDTVSNNFIENTGDLLAGGHYEFAGFDWAQIGILGLYSQPEERALEVLLTDDSEKDRSLNGGVYLELPELTEDVSVYFEADYQQRHVAGTKEPSTGLAAYATLDVSISDFLVLVEGIYLNDWKQKGSNNSVIGKRFDYNYAPTLERIDQEVFDNTDTLGARIRIERLIESLDLLVYVNGMMRMNDFNKDIANLRQIHGFGGFEWSFGDGDSHVYGSSGYRDETQAERQIKTMFHAEFDYLHAVGADLAFHVVSNNEFRTLEGEAYRRGSTLVGVEMAATGALTVEVGYDTQNPSEGVSNFFLAAIISWEINDIFHLRATAGTQRGGIKCIAGVCRDFPGFAGAKAELVTRL